MYHYHNYCGVEKEKTVYGLPRNFKAELFIGKTLDLVCFTTFQTYLHFSEECMVSIEGNVSIGESVSATLPQSLNYIYPLIGQKIIASKSAADGTLSLTFEMGVMLMIIDSSQNFESYSISSHGETLVRV